MRDNASTDKMEAQPNGQFCAQVQSWQTGAPACRRLGPFGPCGSTNSQRSGIEGVKHSGLGSGLLPPYACFPGMARRLSLAQLSLLVFALVLAACLSGPRPDAHSSLATNTFLPQPLSLADAVNLALQRNPNILRAQKDLEAAQGVVIQTRAIAIPKVSLAGNLLRGPTHRRGHASPRPAHLSATTRIGPPSSSWCNRFTKADASSRLSASPG